MTFLKQLFFLLLFFSSLLKIYSQQELKQASKFFNKGDFDNALIEYSKLDTSTIEIDDNFKIGVCYFLAHHEQTNGIPFLEKYIKQADSITTVSYFYLGSLYHKNLDFDKSIQILEDFLQKLEIELKNQTISTEIHDEFKKEAETIIVNCNYGKVMIKSPRKVLAENLGDSVNSKYQDYAPAISLDEKTLVFTSRRPENSGSKISGDGDYFEDIFFSKLLTESLFESKLAGTDSSSGFFNLVNPFEYSNSTPLPKIINSKDHDASIQLSNDGNKLYFYRNSDVWISTKTDTTWSEPIKLPLVNSTSFEPSVYITLDEKTMFISSEREGGIGKLDIFFSEKDSLGNWTEMKNLGSKINTTEDEDISYVSPDNDIIYFASKGHTSMGGYDIFKSIKKDGEWSSPINMGSPINTPYNDAFFVMTPRYNRGYYASERPEGKGGMDLYRLTFANERNPLAELAGLVLQGDSLVPAKSKITIINEVASLNAIHNSKELTGEYLLLVEHGKTYEMIVETEGFAPYKKTFVIPEQIEYFQLYQEIHHVYLRDSYGNIIGQQIITFNAFDDIESATRNDTLKQLFNQSKYSKYVRDSSNSTIDKFIDVKFYITEDSLMRLLEADENLKFIFPDYAEISFLYENNSDFRYALNSYIKGTSTNLNSIKESTLLVNDMKDNEELTTELNKLQNPFEKPIVILFDY
ncbi:MAG: PD40 domain-containing protein, partial [Bacteroidetes bacterium]|nr:PD40 domain-containing protein [Bacteroidota bacterium]